MSLEKIAPALCRMSATGCWQTESITGSLPRTSRERNAAPFPVLCDKPYRKASTQGSHRSFGDSIRKIEQKQMSI